MTQDIKLVLRADHTRTPSIEVEAAWVGKVYPLYYNLPPRSTRARAGN
jgi:hypothetical protein